MVRDNFIFITHLRVCGYGALSLTRGRVCYLQLLLILVSAVVLDSESRWIDSHILLSQIRDSPSVEGQVPVFISPRKGVAQLCPQALGYLFVASCSRPFLSPTLPYVQWVPGS
jgi:hypothetical protein